MTETDTMRTGVERTDSIRWLDEEGTYARPGTIVWMGVTSGLTSIHRQAPYFSCVVALHARTEHGKWLGGGADYALILERLPELEPVVKVHLSTGDGWPMHAVDNAVYWSGQSTWNGEKDGRPKEPSGCGDVEADERGIVWAPAELARHLRVAPEVAAELRDAAIAREDAAGSAKQAWAAILRDNLAAQWEKEAEAALKVIRRET